MDLFAAIGRSEPSSFAFNFDASNRSLNHGLSANDWYLVNYFVLSLGLELLSEVNEVRYAIDTRYIVSDVGIEANSDCSILGPTECVGSTIN